MPFHWQFGCLRPNISYTILTRAVFLLKEYTCEQITERERARVGFAYIQADINGAISKCKVCSSRPTVDDRTYASKTYDFGAVIIALDEQPDTIELYESRMHADQMTGRVDFGSWFVVCSHIFIFAWSVLSLMLLFLLLSLLLLLLWPDAFAVGSFFPVYLINLKSETAFFVLNAQYSIICWNVYNEEFCPFICMKSFHFLVSFKLRDPFTAITLFFYLRISIHFEGLVLA